MFPMTVTISNQAQFNAVVALFQNADTKPAINTAPAVNASKTTPKKEEVKKDSPAVATEAPAMLVANKHPTYTREEAAKEITELAQTKGVDTAKAVLKQFGANHLRDVRPEDYAAVIEAVMAAKG